MPRIYNEIKQTIVETGIALVIVLAARAIKLALTRPDTTSTERRKLIKILGAKVELTEGKEGMNGTIANAEELNQLLPNRDILQPFSNPSNPAARRRTTAGEIWRGRGGFRLHLERGQLARRNHGERLK